MSSPDNSCANVSTAGKFNVTRTTQIAKAGAPLFSDPAASTSAASSPTGTLNWSPPTTAAAGGGGGSVSPMGTPPLAPARPPTHFVTSSVSSRGPTTPEQHGTPPLGPRSNPVPLITPRYQKKSRTNRRMDLTDSFAETSASASELLRQHATESLTITSGPQQYSQDVHFHTYGMYRHGKRQIVTRSVGYSSDGDLVMTREDYSEASDVDNSVHRGATVISGATVLDPEARRPLTDSELHGSRKLNLRRRRYKKYPGISVPRNKRVRNRLMNDYFVNQEALRILEAARARREEGLDDGAHAAGPDAPRTGFRDIPASVLRAFDLADDAQERELARLGAVMRSPSMHHAQPPPRDPDSAEARFQALNLRLRGELQHALNSGFLSQQMEDLEVCFSEFIDRGATEESLVYNFRDGYGRLVCHGVAAYYQLVSESRAVAGDESAKFTYVAFPKSKKAGVRAVRLPYAPLMHLLKGKSSGGKVPAKHPLSPSTTPTQGPQPSPGTAAVVVAVAPGDHNDDGGNGDADDALMMEPMSPLDLNENAKLNIPPPMTAADNATGSSSGGGASKQDPRPPSGGGKRKVLVNPTVVMTVQRKLLRQEIPVYVPHLQLSELALVVERCTATTTTATTTGGGDGSNIVVDNDDDDDVSDSSDSD